MSDIKNYGGYEVGQKINHDVLGEGTVVGFEPKDDRYGRELYYVSVHFVNDKEDVTRIFLPEDLTKHSA